MNRLIQIATLVFAILLTGCASTIKMPMKDDGDKISSSGNPVYLMSVTMGNVCRDRFQPSLDLVQVVREDGSVKQDMKFAMDSKGTYESEDDKRPPKYLVRLELAAGHYTIRGMNGSGRAFPINFTVYAPLHAPLKVEGPGVFYIGAVNATIRERQGNEFRAGQVIPLIDQAVACASTGTFDVDISDRFDEDIALFRKTFPALVAANVQKAVLPPFDRKMAQKWWEAN